jgi:hypothetical protein
MLTVGTLYIIVAGLSARGALLLGWSGECTRIGADCGERVNVRFR